MLLCAEIIIIVQIFSYSVLWFDIDAFLCRLKKLTKQGRNSLMQRRFHRLNFLVLRTEKRKRLNYPFKNMRCVYGLLYHLVIDF